MTDRELICWNVYIMYNLVAMPSAAEKRAVQSREPPDAKWPSFRNTHEYNYNTDIRVAAS